MLDVRMPNLSGIDLLQKLRTEDCHWPVVIMTGHGDIPLAVKAMKLGAMEFLEKPFDDLELERVVREGFAQLPASIARSQKCKEARSLAASLSPRQKDVFNGVVNGLTNKEIAQRIGISHRTVESYRLDMMHKLCAQNLADLIELKRNRGVQAALSR
ncbi:two-component system response regulator FixJ [Novosphingobium marinum]|uniref:Two-component system response regulator FixJ n=1 Tax=Novosphingobium marinum TaxID=1514948 RepID=A0A7Z0BV73_9SPHN|nr:two-component system response regulator FixJ [Novosphingobium marinum]